MKIIKWRNNLIIYLVVILLVNLLLLRFPLTNVFGFEFAIINSFLLVLLSGFYTVYFFRSYFISNKTTFLKELFKSLTVFLLIPPVISITNSFFTGFCSFYDGVLFYLFITSPAVIIGAAIGLTANIYFKRFQAVAVIIIYLFILSIVAFEVYFNPQVYFYNPILTYFPGTIYDEAIAVNLKLIVYRLLNLVYFSFIVITARNTLKNNILKRKLRFTIYLLVFPGIFYLFSPQLGYSTTFKSLADDLGRTVISKHFVTHYDKRIKKEEIKQLTLREEFYYQQLVKYFKVEPESKINSFIFYDNDQKKKFFGSKNADVAKPWLNQLYISIDNAEQTLKHEIAHCFSARFGAGLFKLAAGFNPVLIEGIAVAADGFYDENTNHFMAALAYKNDYRVDLESLLSKFSFYNQPSSISYIYAGSFVEFLIAKYGIEKFKQYYLNGEIKETYGIGLKLLVDEYYGFLQTGIPAKNKDMANYYFGRKSLFQKLCPRTISNKLNKAWEHFENNNFVGARSIFQNVLQKSDNYSAIIGLTKCYEKLNKKDKAIELLKNYSGKFAGTSYFYNIELYLADLSAKNYDYHYADSLYKKVLTQFPNRRLFTLSSLRLQLLENDSLLIKYLNGNDFSKYLILERFNKNSFKYSSFPSWIYLAKLLNIEYDLFVKNINKRIVVDDYISSYSAFKLSGYMFNNYHFKNALKMAALSLRYNKDRNFKQVLINQFEFLKWVNDNHKNIFNHLEWTN